MKTQALKGMRDLLPAEQTLRDYIQGKILVLPLCDQHAAR